MNLKDVKIGQLVQYPDPQWVKDTDTEWIDYSSDIGIVIRILSEAECDNMWVEAVVDVLWISSNKTDLVDVAAIKLISEVK
tara:strand:+ start:92 stop:334 length:243 start_codon:yes stop_codon:yes gene_type:complete